jgi:hypothetical protein
VIISIRKKGQARKKGFSPLGVLRHPLVTWLTALLVLIQLGTAAIHLAVAATPSEQAVVALSAAIGQTVSLCGHSGENGHSGGPRHSSSCCDDCPLCRLSHHAEAILPERAAPLHALTYLVAALSPRQDPPSLPTIFFSTAQPRAPPVPV